jgi:hypothetical protein
LATDEGNAQPSGAPSDSPADNPAEPGSDTEDPAREPATTAEAPLSLTGAQLYALHCSGCHGDLASSKKLGRVAAEIRGAISGVDAMRPLSALSEEDIAKIERVLQTQESIVQCRDPAQRGRSRHGVRRLTRPEIDASLGAVLPAYWLIQNQVRDLPELDEMSEVDRYDPFHSIAQARQWALVVSEIGEHLAKNPSFRAGIAPCFGADTIDENCWQQVFTSYGKRVFRRPVSDDEAGRLAQSVKNLPSAEAIFLTAHLLFRAPDFLFHIETGIREEGERVRLSSHEVANRISFATIGGPPDSALLAAADADGLQKLADVDAQVRRLIELPAARVKLTQFFNEWLQLSHIAQPHTLYLDWILKLGLAGGTETIYKQEIQDFLSHIIWKEKGTFAELMTRPIAFPRFQGLYYGEGINQPFSALAGIYGNDKFSGFSPENAPEPTAFPAPNHPGLAMRAGFLSGGRFETSPILRGVFVLRRLLCETLPSPDFNIVNTRLDIVGAFDHTTTPNFEIVNKSTAAPECATCHSKINPVGFAFEAFDSVGRPRSEERVYDLTNLFQGPVAAHPLPYPVEGLQFNEGAARVVSAPQDLADELAKSAKARACMSIYFLRHLERRPETVQDGCALSEAVKSLSEGEPVLNLFVRSIANEDIFWRGR